MSLFVHTYQCSGKSIPRLINGVFVIKHWAMTSHGPRYVHT